MSWMIGFFSGVTKDILKLPPHLQARIIRLFDLMEKQGVNLGAPHSKKITDDLYEVRAKAKEGIARGIYCYCDNRKIVVLHVFMKKTQKIPVKDLKLAIDRKKKL